MLEGREKDILFEVPTPIGFRVRVTSSQWSLITKVKHPIMAGKEAKVKDALKTPSLIRVSRSDHSVYLFYLEERAGRWVCAVAKKLDDDGFLITAYPTVAIKEGVQVWPK